jgi:hypothetical protein
MTEIVFYCPNVDLSVQHLLDDNVQQKSDEEITNPSFASRALDCISSIRKPANY